MELQTDKECARLCWSSVDIKIATNFVMSEKSNFTIPKSTTRMSDDNGHDKLVRRVYVGLAGMDENMVVLLMLVDDISILG